MHLNRTAFTKYFVLHYKKACTKHFPPVLLCTTNLQYILICTTKLAQSTSQNNFVLQSFHKACPSIYYFVLQSLHTALPSTTLYYKACTKHVPVLLCTTRLAQSTSQYYFVTTRLAQSVSQYYFVLQSLHKARSSATLFDKARKKYFPVLLCTTSSTAQGGGGSFKNRKPIGRDWLLWIRDGRAKPLMDWKVLDLSHSFSLSFSDYLPTYQPIFYVSIYPSIYRYLSIYLSIYLSMYLSIYLSIYLSTYLPTYLPIGFLFLKLP